MLEEIRKLIGEVLGVTSAEIIKLREAWLEEQATEDARYAVNTALVHPEGSTTPLSETHYRAQQRAAKIRKQAEKILPEAVSLLVALEIAEQRRDEAERHLGQAWKSGAARLSDGLNEAARDWFPRLANHGVHPHYLKQHSNETVAIIADLIIWKAKDARFQNADNPWRQVLGIYAGRRIDKPYSGGRKGASVSGTPRPDRHHVGAGDYRFDEMVSAAWEMEARPVTGPVHDAPRQQPAGDIDEYALPASVDAVIAPILRTEAERWVDIDYENWGKELSCALDGDLWGHTAEEAIAKVEAASPTTKCTPFSYFLDAARKNGLAAGHAAYRKATTRRFMLMLAEGLDRHRRSVEEADRPKASDAA